MSAQQLNTGILMDQERNFHDCINSPLLITKHPVPVCSLEVAFGQHCPLPKWDHLCFQNNFSNMNEAIFDPPHPKYLTCNWKEKAKNGILNDKWEIFIYSFEQKKKRQWKKKINIFFIIATNFNETSVLDTHRKWLFSLIIVIKVPLNVEKSYIF